MRKRARISTPAGFQRSAKELQIHCAVADLLRVAAHPATIWFHPANGEERSASVGAKLKRMGVLPGVADFALTLPDGRSAFLEIKTADGVQSLHQIAFEARCRELGVSYAVVRSLDEAGTILAYWGALRKLARAA